MNQPLPRREPRLHGMCSTRVSSTEVRRALCSWAFIPAPQTQQRGDPQGSRTAGDPCLGLALLQGLAFLAYLSIFGFQPELCPARGLQAAGLGVDLDALRSLHHQRARGRLQPATQRGYTAPWAQCSCSGCCAAPQTLLMCRFSPALRGKCLCSAVKHTTSLIC